VRPDWNETGLGQRLGQQKSGEGVTVMTDWKLIQKPESGVPGKVEKLRDYELTPGVAHVYNEGVLHSPRRDGDTKLIRIEGRDFTKVKRENFEAAA
jgi:hypothetical protein